MYAMTMTSNGIFMFHNLVCYVQLYLKPPSSLFQLYFFIVLFMSADFVGNLFTVVPLFLEPRKGTKCF